MRVLANILKLETSYKELEQPGTSWGYLERAGTTWNYLEQGGTTYNEMDSATNWHKKVRNLLEETVRATPLTNRIQQLQ